MQGLATADNREISLHLVDDQKLVSWSSNWCIIDNGTFERVEELQYLGTT